MHAGTVGDSHKPDPNGGHVWNCVCQLHRQFHHRTVLQPDDVLYGVRSVPLLCRLGSHHDHVGRLVLARDEGHRCGERDGRMGHVRVPSFSYNCACIPLCMHSSFHPCRYTRVPCRHPALDCLPLLECHRAGRFCSCMGVADSGM